MSARKVSEKTTKASPGKKADKGFTDDERAAMKERAAELKRAAKKGAGADDEAEVLAKIAELPAGERALAERLHALVKAAAPGLVPKTWYGMPAYSRDGKVFCFFQSATKFKTRYATLGFSAEARLDDGNMWPTSFALLKLGPAEEARIKALLERALG